MKKTILLFSMFMLIFTLSACGRSSDLEKALNDLEEAHSYTVYTRIPTTYFGPREIWQMREGDREYHLVVFREMVENEYFLIPKEDGLYFYQPNQQGLWESEKIPGDYFDDEDDAVDTGGDTVLDFDASWFEFDDEYYVLKEAYFEKFLGEDSPYTLNQVRINLDNGEFFITMDVTDQLNQKLSINISVTDINSTELIIPFTP